MAKQYDYPVTLQYIHGDLQVNFQAVGIGTVVKEDLKSCPLKKGEKSIDWIMQGFRPIK